MSDVHACSSNLRLIDYLIVHNIAHEEVRVIIDVAVLVYTRVVLHNIFYFQSLSNVNIKLL
jgi:hypothetical protein